MRTGRAVIIGILVFVVLVIIGLNYTDSQEDIVPDAELIENTEVNTEMKGVWVSTAYCLDFPSEPNLLSDELKTELDSIVNNAKKWGLNTIFFQVRPCSDSFYNSKIFPVSRFLSADRELPEGFDPLAYIIEKAHSNGIELHAWINPLRATTGSAESPEWDVTNLPDIHPAKQNPDYVVAYADGKLYYNVGIPQVRQLVADGVKEIIENYDVDGIHFDDYFYPYPIEGEEFDDEAAYEMYGNDLELSDFRRKSVNEMIKLVYETVKDYNSDIAFGISPQGIWANQNTSEKGSDTGASIQSYSDLYADSVYWMEQGIVDYICPQIYWSTEQTGVEFKKVYDWWSNIAKETNIKLYVGMAAYKVGSDEYGWNNEGELKNQIDYCRNSQHYNGFIMFRYEFLLDNQLNLLSSW